MDSSTFLRKSSPPIQNLKQARMIIQGYSVFLTLLIVAGAGPILILFFPMGSLAVGVFLYRKAPLLYVSFTWWITFVGTVIRRIIDYRCGYLTWGPWGLTGQLVAFISVATLAKYLPKAHKQGALPFIFCIGAVSYSVLVGLIQNPANKVITSSLEWLCPILFGFHLFINWRDYPSYRQTIQRAFLWGVLVMGTYGILQFILAPEWDRFWLNNITATSFGLPEPFKIRVSSTLGSPQGFASVMMAGLIVLFCSSQQLIRFLGSGVGYLSFLLSMARTAWLSFMAGLPIFLISLRSSFQIRTIISLLLVIILVVPLASMEPFSELINERLESFSSSTDDHSYEARLEGYNQLLNQALAEFSGNGQGFRLNVEASIGASDSTILPMLFTLGWFGTIPYLVGVFLLLFLLFQGNTSRIDPFNAAARAITLGIFAQFGLNFMFVGPIGMIFWGFLAMGIAGHKYYLHQRNTS
ncbi:MAG: O-antigen ligase domain-containing protein [Symploca sp. SIO3E6]|nr:O-antigen ligase domain-containing protein [Caldora sp. SIO3E6]